MRDLGVGLEAPYQHQSTTPPPLVVPYSASVGYVRLNNSSQSELVIFSENLPEFSQQSKPPTTYVGGLPPPRQRVGSAAPFVDQPVGIVRRWQLILVHLDVQSGELDE